jgi:hypothetical protein
VLNQPAAKGLAFASDVDDHHLQQVRATRAIAA